MNRKELKRKARNILKKHYSILLVVMILGAFIGAEEVVSLEEFRGTLSMTQNISDRLLDNRIDGFADITLFVFNEYNTNIKSPGEILTLMPRKVLNIDLDTSAGVFASVVNTLSSGHVLNYIFDYLVTLTGADNLGVAVAVSIVAAAFALLFFLVIRVFIVINSRIFLEARTYDKIPSKRIFYLINNRKWGRVALSMFTTFVVTALGFLLIVPGIIKLYEYSMVPYILAENPSLSGKEARKLSSKMMYGHKWESFKIDLTILPLRALSFLTWGLFGIFYVNPYNRAIYSEYYSYLRTNLITADESVCIYFNDVYLFEKPDKEDVYKAYADLINIDEKEPEKPRKRMGISAFFAYFFGIIPFFSSKEKEYTLYNEWLLKCRQTKDILELKTYPERLSTNRVEPKSLIYTYIHPYRRYNVVSLILMFFIFSFIGWLWEVSFHLVSDGIFVNRGTMFGPWLPIYGFGGIGMLILFYRLRNKPVIEFISMLVFSGIIEYLTAYILESRYGMKWWDYTGYFINIDARICAEGLLVFALGGICVVYLLAPVLDNILCKIKPVLAVVIAVVLLSLFVTDAVYSFNNPNTGVGITEYDTVINAGE